MHHAALSFIPVLRAHRPARSQRLSREPKLRSPSGVIKDHKLRLEENVAEDGLSDAGIALEPAEAAPALRGGRVVEVAARDDGGVAFDLEREVGQGGGAAEDVAAVGLTVGGAGHLRVVGGDEVIGEEEQRCSRVCDGGDALSHGGSGAYGVPARGEAPEALGVVHGRVGDVAGVFGRVDVAEVVAAGLTFLQVGGEEGGVEAGLGVGEERLDLVGRHGVDGAESEAEETVACVLSEFRADGLSQLDSLAGDGCTADVDDIGVDIAAGGAAVSIADAPSLASVDCGGWGVGGVVDVVAGLLVRGQLGREHPAIICEQGGTLKTTSNIQVGRSSVKIQVQGLTTNGDRLEISLIVLFRAGNDSSIIGARGLGSGCIDLGWCIRSNPGVLAVDARQGNRTGYLLALELGWTLRDSEFGGACHIAGSLRDHWVRSCGDN